MSSVQPRLHRLFAADGKCFDVAIDHGFFNQRSFLTGIEAMRDAVGTVVAAGPDAVQLSLGQARWLQSIAGPDKPALVLRTDAANVYGRTLPSLTFSELIAKPVDQALRLDAACVVVNLFLLPEQPDLYRQCIRNINRLKPACERFGMPLMIEPLVMRVDDIRGGYAVDGDLDKILPLVRQAVELGADVIKADPCDDVEQYHEVVRIAGEIPVLVRGGGRVTDEEILRRTRAVILQGASGIVYGRNVIQHENPRGMTQALMHVVHRNASVEDALEILVKAPHDLGGNESVSAG